MVRGEGGQQAIPAYIAETGAGPVSEGKIDGGGLLPEGSWKKENFCQISLSWLSSWKR